MAVAAADDAQAAVFEVDDGLVVVGVGLGLVAAADFAGSPLVTVEEEEFGAFEARVVEAVDGAAETVFAQAFGDFGRDVAGVDGGAGAASEEVAELRGCSNHGVSFPGWWRFNVDGLLTGRRVRECLGLVVGWAVSFTAGW